MPQYNSVKWAAIPCGWKGTLGLASHWPCVTLQWRIKRCAMLLMEYGTLFTQGSASKYKLVKKQIPRVSGRLRLASVLVFIGLRSTYILQSGRVGARPLVCYAGNEKHASPGAQLLPIGAKSIPFVHYTPNTGPAIGVPYTTTATSATPKPNERQVLLAHGLR